MISPADRPAELRLDRRWPFGLYGHNTDVNSRLFRPYNRIVATGKPIGTLSHLFLFTGESLRGTPAKGFRLQSAWNLLSPTRRHPIYRTLMRLLGTLCYTPNGMILYFPGYRGIFITGYDKGFRPIDKREPFFADHFSLEPDFRRWHITATDKDRVRRLNVLPAAEDLVFWFAMSVEPVTEFEPIYRRNTWRFQCPDSDARRRADEVIQACNGAVFQIVQSPTVSQSQNQTFWHIEFAVSRTPVEGYPQPPLHLPPKPLAEIAVPTKQIPARSHVVRLANFGGAVVISATTIEGKLSVPVLLTHG